MTVKTIYLSYKVSCNLQLFVIGLIGCTFFLLLVLRTEYTIKALMSAFHEGYRDRITLKLG